MSIWLFALLGLLFLPIVGIVVFIKLLSKKQMRDIKIFLRQGKLEDAWSKAADILIAKTRSLAMVTVAEAASRVGVLDSLRRISLVIDSSEDNIRADSFIILSAFSKNRDDLRTAYKSYKVTRGFGSLAEYQYGMIDWLRSLVEADNPWPDLREACAKFKAA